MNIGKTGSWGDQLLTSRLDAIHPMESSGPGRMTAQRSNEIRIQATFLTIPRAIF